MAEIRDVKWGHERAKTADSKKPLLPPPTQEELSCLFKKIYDNGGCCVAATLNTTFYDSIRSKNNSSELGGELLRVDDILNFEIVDGSDPLSGDLCVDDRSVGENADGGNSSILHAVDDNSCFEIVEVGDDKDRVYDTIRSKKNSSGGELIRVDDSSNCEIVDGGDRSSGDLCVDDNSSDNLIGENADGSNSSILHALSVDDNSCFEIVDGGDDKDRVLGLRFSQLYIEELETWTLDALIFLGRSFDLSFGRDDCKWVEKITRDQSASPYWFMLRCGRITASKFKSACRTKLNKPSKSLIKSVCYPDLTTFTHKFTDYGIKNEGKAYADFECYMQRQHQSYNQIRSGLVISPEYPEFGASPDGISNCNCCKKSIFEIKCPYKLRNESGFESLLTFKNPYLMKTDDNKYNLNKNHEYYYQIQMQLALTDLDICNFIIWNKGELLIIKITRDHDFWLENSEKARSFFYNIIMPELLGKYFSYKNI